MSNDWLNPRSLFREPANRGGSEVRPVAGPYTAWLMGAKKSRGTELSGEALVELAIACADGDPYGALVRLLLADDAGARSAAAELETMQTARLFAPEDETLAHFQLALLYQRGGEVSADPKRALEHLRAAARSVGLRAKLPAALDRALDQVREAIGLPAELDAARPLGPASPHQPGWLRPDHATAAPLGPFPRATPGKRAARVPAAPSESIYGLALSRDGRILASGGVGGELLLWDVERKQPQRKGPSLGTSTHSLSFDAAGRRLAIGSDDSHWVEVYSLDTDEVLSLKAHRASANAVAFHPEEARLYSGDFDGRLHEWELGKKKPTRALELDGSVYALAVNPDGAYVFAGLDQAIARIDTSSWTVDETLHAHTHIVHGLALSSDGNRLVSASRDDMVGVWDARTGALLHLLGGHTDCVYGAAFTPSGRVVSGGLDGRILVWDLAAETHEELAHAKNVHGVVAHERTMAIGGDDGVLWLEVD